MPRPTTKEQLLKVGEDNFAKLSALIDSMSKEEQEQVFSFEDRDKNIRDVLIHLYEWHQLLLNWIRGNMAGNNVNFLPDPYNWKNYPQMNIAFREKHSNTSLEESRKLLMQSHADVMKLVGTFSDEQLFTKKYFPWTGTTSLGSYCISSVPSHYDWAIKKIKQHYKNLRT